jgi:hypothetical protein
MSDSRLEAPVLFVDRNSGGRTFRDLLVGRGLKVVLHDEEFGQKVPDEHWLAEVGRRGWVAITGDNATTSSPLFLQSLDDSKAFVFILKGLNGASAEGKATCIVEAYEKIERLIQSSKPPAVWRVGKDGVVREFKFRPVLERMRRGKKT